MYFKKWENVLRYEISADMNTKNEFNGMQEMKNISEEKKSFDRLKFRLDLAEEKMTNIKERK